MKDASGGVSGLDRRGAIPLAAAGAGMAGGCGAALQEPSETRADITHQPSPSFTNEVHTPDSVVETVIAWGATHTFEVVKTAKPDELKA
jgi:pyruvate dehydrogenase (quinone)